MNDPATVTVITLAYGLIFGLLLGVILLPVGRWLGGDLKGKLAALACGVFGFFTATLVTVLLNVP